MRINGEKVLKSDYDAFQKVSEKLYRLVRKLPLTGRCDAAEQFTYANEQRLPGMLLKCVLTRQVAARDKITVDSKAFAAKKADFIRGLGRGGRSLDEVAEELGPEAVVLLPQMVEADFLTECLVRDPRFGYDLSATEAEIDERQKLTADFTARAVRNNEAARAVLRKARARLLAGAKFVQVAREVSEVHPEQGADWCTVQLGELPDETPGEPNPLRKWLESARVGDISEPMDMDDGISIVGLVATFEGDAPEGAARPTEYKLVRCTRYYREKAIELTREETRRQLEQEKHEAAVRQLGERLFGEAVIEFPHGTNFYPTAEDSRRWWQDEFKRRRF